MGDPLRTFTTPRQGSVTEFAQPATLTLDSRGCIKSASDGAEQLFGYSSRELSGLHISVLVSALDDIEVPGNENTLLVQYLSHCGVAFTARRKNHQAFDCHLFVTALHDPRSGSYRIVVTEPESVETKVPSGAQEPFHHVAA